MYEFILQMRKLRLPEGHEVSKKWRDSNSLFPHLGRSGSSSS